MMKLFLYVLLLLSPITLFSLTFQEAQKALEKGNTSLPRTFIKDNPNTPESLYLSSLLHFKEKKFTLSLKELNTLLTSYSYSDLADDALILSGDIYLIRGEGEKAIREYERCFTLYPDRETAPLALEKIALYYYQRKEKEKALTLLKKLLLLFPNYKRKEKIEDIIKRLQKTSPSTPSSQPHKTKKRQKEPTPEQKAWRYFQRKKVPSDEGEHQIYILQCILYWGEKERAKLKDKNKLKELKKYLADCYFTLASAFQRNSLYSKAIETYSTLIKKFPNSPFNRFAEYRLILIYKDKGDLNKSLTMLDKYMKKYPPDPGAYSHKAKILYKLGKYEEAIKILKKYQELFPQTQEREWIYLRIGQSYFHLGKYKEARKTLEEFLNLYPGSFYAGTAKNLLREIEKREEK